MRNMFVKRFNDHNTAKSKIRTIAVVESLVPYGARISYSLPDVRFTQGDSLKVTRDGGEQVVCVDDIKQVQKLLGKTVSC